MQGSVVSTSERMHKLPVLTAVLLALFALLAASIFTAGTGLWASPASQHRVSPHVVKAPTHYIFAGPVNNSATFRCQSNTALVRCYGPQQIRKAYNIQSVLDSGITGKGRTIVIIDAFQSPTLKEDLHTFDTLFGLNDPQLNIVAPDGLTPFDPNDQNQVGWSGEITLDVEWAHAIAPDAAITLVLAKSNEDKDILSATKYAIDHNLGDVISQSFGEAETCMDRKLLKQQHQLFFEATLKGITLLASSGDQGSAQPTCDGSSFFLSASTPASDPFVTSVGGTQLNADAITGEYKSEVVWNEPKFSAAGGGGFSTIYRKPFYQFGTRIDSKYRGEPDVSYNAAINGGVLTVWTQGGTQGVYIFGGTSAGSPQWAGIVALGNQMAHKRMGFLNPAFYLIGHTGFYNQGEHDITVGDNSYTFQDSNGKTVTIPGYSAGKGWDAATGWGTPNVAKLLPVLTRLAVFSASDATKVMNNDKL